jgi:hypothetical protein
VKADVPAPRHPPWWHGGDGLLRSLVSSPHQSSRPVRGRPSPGGNLMGSSARSHPPLRVDRSASGHQDALSGAVCGRPWLGHTSQPRLGIKNGRSHLRHDRIGLREYGVGTRVRAEPARSGLVSGPWGWLSCWSTKESMRSCTARGVGYRLAHGVLPFRSDR